MSSVEIRSVDAAAVRAAADDYARRLLAEHPEVEEVVVFGSFTRGSYAPGSDLDVLIVLAGSERAFRDRIPDYLPERFPLGVDLLPYTRAELDRLPPGLRHEMLAETSWRYRR